MPSYRYCFLDSVDCIAEFHVIASGTDGEAGRLQAKAPGGGETVH
jgi:hypothetical protein